MFGNRFEDRQEFTVKAEGPKRNCPEEIHLGTTRRKRKKKKSAFLKTFGGALKVGEERKDTAKGGGRERKKE